ncbi:MAG: formylglycine-generating enzyme family protein [Candidatus Omnitrophota bacterium]
MNKTAILLLILILVNGEELPTIIIDIPGLPEGAKPLEMVRILSGKFIMGSPENERGRYVWQDYSGMAITYDWPQHEVTITKDFYLGKHEITLGQWLAFMGAMPNYSTSPLSGISNDLPITKVSWFKCMQFIDKLNELKIGTFRLPTEAEWEYVCRAGTTTRFSFSDALECVDDVVVGEEAPSKAFCEIMDKYMWWYGNSHFRYYDIRKVGLKIPNNWGLYDMHGNVFEWCYDYSQKTYMRSPQIDPKGPNSPQNPASGFGRKVIKGGCYCSNASECRSAYRASEETQYDSEAIGFRVVLEIEPPIALQIYDNPTSTNEDYTNKTDFDSAGERNLTLRWNIPAWDGTSWDVYVRDGLGGYQFLARAALDANQLDWFPGAANIAAKFASGPEFGHVYRFRVVRLAWPIGPEDVYDQTAATGFAMESATAPDLAPPVMPNLNPGQIAVYDDLLGGNDLAPQNGSGSDADKSTQRAIQIAWNFGSNLADVSDYRVLVKVNEQGEFQPLGNTNSGNITYYYWSPKETFYTAKEFSPGPQTGNSYRFKVVEFNPKNKVNAELTTGLLYYTVE